jgi:phage terminase large subunit-like protein
MASAPTVSRSRSNRRSTSSQPGDPPELDDFAAFCAELTLDTRGPFVVEPFQRTILRDYFTGATETLVLLPKKNGKSTLVAALALFHLLTTQDAECYIAASSREQAGIILKQARKFINGSPDLRRLFEMNKREIQSLTDEGVVKVLASDVDTADGVIPTLAIVDELHRHKSADLYGVFRDGLGPRDGRMITISTAGDDSESPLGQMRAKAYGLATLDQQGAYRYARSSDGDYVMHEWALDPEDDRTDLEVVKAANPASWQTIAKLRTRQASPSMTPWGWARFACGVWLQGEDTAIGPLEWSACGTDAIPDPADATVRIGLDLGFKEDTTGIVVHWLDGEGVAWIARAVVLRPPTERGVGLRKAAILRVVGDLAAEFGAREVVIDPENDGEVLAQDLEDDLDLEVVAHSQKPTVMAQAAERFYAAVREEKLRHPKDDDLTRHVLNAHRKATDDGRWRFVKENKQSRKVIDALIAAAMAHNVAVDATGGSTEPMAAWI